VKLLATLAEHNAWANAKIFEAAAAISTEALGGDVDGYDSVIGILRHLVQVEHSFFELANGRQTSRLGDANLGTLRELCAGIDVRYVQYARTLESKDANVQRFLVPWFGFEITRAEGVLQPLTHSHKHRADVSMLLPRLGGNGVEMDLIQWLAEARSQQR